MTMNGELQSAVDAVREGHALLQENRLSPVEFCMRLLTARRVFLSAVRRCDAQCEDQGPAPAFIEETRHTLLELIDAAVASLPDDHEAITACVFVSGVHRAAIAGGPSPVTDAGV